jgi:DHA2 family multidrug resistance protein
VAFLTLPNHLRTGGAAMLTLLRNVARSIGISVAIAQLQASPHACTAVITRRRDGAARRPMTRSSG